MRVGGRCRWQRNRESGSVCVRSAELCELGEREVDPECVGERGGEVRRGDLHSRPAQGTRRGQAGAGTDDVGGLGAAHGAREAREAESGVSHHDDGPDAQARVQDGREVRTGWDEE